MTQLDAKVLLRTTAEEVLRGAKPALLDAVMGADDLRQGLLDLQQDTEATLAALQQETNPLRAAGLRDDLVLALPARKLALLAVAQTRLSSDAHAAFENALEIIVKVGVSIAKTLVMGMIAG